MPKVPKAKNFMPSYPMPEKTEKENKKVNQEFRQECQQKFAEINTQISGLQDAIRRTTSEVQQAVDLMGNLSIALDTANTKSQRLENQIDLANSYIKSQKQ